MIIVVQCAASKRSGAGHLLSASGKPVDFVADPRAAPPDPGRIFARPDDLSDEAMSWRRVLLKYNQEAEGNPLGLYPACQLYENRIYGRLADRFGLRKVYILSAGWGLIAADFLTPYYDVTFGPSAERYKRRRKTNRYDDFCMLPPGTDEEIVFFGGKDYLPLFCSLTSPIRASKTIFYSSAHPPQASGCALKRFDTTTRTNWHYECANAFLDGAISTR
jgi:hypothetical protein